MDVERVNERYQQMEDALNFIDAHKGGEQTDEEIELVKGLAQALFAADLVREDTVVESAENKRRQMDKELIEIKRRLDADRAAAKEKAAEEDADA